jgi:hypothetical protein
MGRRCELVCAGLVVWVSVVDCLYRRLGLDEDCLAGEVSLSCLWTRQSGFTGMRPMRAFAI